MTGDHAAPGIGADDVLGSGRGDAPGLLARLRIPPGGSVQDGTVTLLGRGLIESTGLLAADPVRAPTAPCRWSC